MAKKIEKVNVVNVKNFAFKSPKSFVEGLTAAGGNLEYTKVIQTFVFETSLLRVSLFKDGKSFFTGIVKWIGNVENSSEGSVICADTGSELKMILPNEENTQEIIYEVDKYHLRIDTYSKTRCSVCGKGLEIFDELRSCPLCNARAHQDHILEWIKMRHSCPICKKELILDNRDTIRPKE